MKFRLELFAILVMCLCLVTACQTSPTAAPASAPTAAPTAQVAPSISPASTEVATQTPLPIIATIEDYNPESLCDHPYLPLRPETKWTLSTIDVVMTMEVISLAANESEAAAQLTRKYDFGEQYDEAWRCTTDGIYGYDITSYSSSDGLMQPVGLISHSGYYLPQASLLVPGYKWDEKTITLNQGYTLTTDLHYTVLSMNPVSVTNQQLPGLQVQVTGQLTAVDQTGKQSERAVDYEREFALGVGLVREDQLVLRKITAAK